MKSAEFEELHRKLILIFGDIELMQRKIALIDGEIKTLHIKTREKKLKKMLDEEEEERAAKDGKVYLGAEHRK